MYAPRKNTGSALLMAVALLTIIAMLGSTFLVISYMDSKQNRALATAAPITMKSVANRVLLQILSERVEDLHIAGNQPYGAAATLADRIDYPHEDLVDPNNNVDPALACTEMYEDPPGSNNWKWRHISHLPNTFSDNPNDVPINDPARPLVDTDGDGSGDGSGDAILWNTYVRDSDNREYWAAVRIIDASSLINVNTAYRSEPAAAGSPMPATNVSLERLLQTIRAFYPALPDPAGFSDALQSYRGGAPPLAIGAYNSAYVIRPLHPDAPGGTVVLPFDTSDMLAVAWGGASPSSASGRLYGLLGDYYTLTRPYLTTWSASRIAVAYPPPVSQADKADLNDSSGSQAEQFDRLYDAFYNLLPAGLPGNQRRDKAAQLAVNAMDFRDTDKNVTVVKMNHTIATADDTASILAYGIERQPFVTELFQKKVADNTVPAPIITQYSAIELFNPYEEDIPLDGYRFVGSVPDPGGAWTGKTIPACSYFVIVSDENAIPVFNTSPADPNRNRRYMEIANFDISQGVKIYRSREEPPSASPPDAKDILVGDESLAANDPLGPLQSNSEVRAWDATLSHAKYTLQDAYGSPAGDYTNNTILNGTADSTNTYLGRDNPAADYGVHNDKLPCPVYVRNGPFINVGELNRVFMVGPDSAATLRSKLTNYGSINNGRLSMSTTEGAVVEVPLGCLASEFFTVESPLADNVDQDNNGPADNVEEDVVYGRININTAPEWVLHCLPGLEALQYNGSTQATHDNSVRTRVVREIIAYRDLLDLSAVAVSDYSAGRDVPTGIAGLRDNDRVPHDADSNDDQLPGFACTGEVAIPIWLRGNAAGVLPQNSYSATNNSPLNYRLAGAGQDDGLGGSGREVVDDLVKNHVYYAWLSNQITVRSDVYIAYIRVQIGNDVNATSGVQKYVALIDRSNCRTPQDTPKVLLFTEIR